MGLVEDAIRIPSTTATIAVDFAVGTEGTSTAFVVPTRRTSPVGVNADAAIFFARASNIVNWDNIIDAAVHVDKSNGVLVAASGDDGVTSINITIGIVDTASAIAINNVVGTSSTGAEFVVPTVGAVPS